MHAGSPRRQAAPPIWSEVRSLEASLTEVDFHLAIVGAVPPDLPAGVRARYMPVLVTARELPAHPFGIYGDLVAEALLAAEAVAAPSEARLIELARHFRRPRRAVVIATAADHGALHRCLARRREVNPAA